MRGKWRAWLFGTVALGLGVWFVAASESFKTCVQQAQQGENSEATKEGISQLLLPLDVGRRCSGAFIDENSEAIVALFTIILGIATWFLWRATRDLVNDARNTGAQQIAQSTALARATETVADAAKVAADAAAKANELTREMFIAENRPWVAVKDFEISGQLSFKKDYASIGVHFNFVNFGKSPAIEIGFDAVLCSLMSADETLEPLKVQADLVRQMKSGLKDEQKMPGAFYPGDPFPRSRVIVTKPGALSDALKESSLIIPVVVGVVTYKHRAGSDTFTTCFMFNVYDINKGTTVGFIPGNGNVDFDRLRVIRRQEGWEAT